MKKLHYFSIAIFFLALVFGIMAFFFFLGFCWTPSARNGIICAVSGPVQAFGPLLFIIPAWMILLRGERARESTKISTLSILAVIIGIIVSVLAIWNFIGLFNIVAIPL